MWVGVDPPHWIGLGDNERDPKLWYGLSFPLSPRAPSPHREGSEDLDRMVFMGESFEDWCLAMGQVSSCPLRLETGEEGTLR